MKGNVGIFATDSGFDLAPSRLVVALAGGYLDKLFVDADVFEGSKSTSGGIFALFCGLFFAEEIFRLV